MHKQIYRTKRTPNGFNLHKKLFRGDSVLVANSNSHTFTGGTQQTIVHNDSRYSSYIRIYQMDAAPAPAAVCMVM